MLQRRYGVEGSLVLGSWFLQGPPATRLVGVLKEVPAAVRHEFSPPAVQCESRASPDLLEGDGLASPVVDVEELGVLIFFAPGGYGTGN